MAQRNKGEKKTIPSPAKKVVKRPQPAAKAKKGQCDHILEKANLKHLPKEDENLLIAITAKRKPGATTIWGDELSVIQRNDLRDFLTESGYTTCEVFLFLVDLFHSILL